MIKKILKLTPIIITPLTTISCLVITEQDNLKENKPKKSQEEKSKDLIDYLESDYRKNIVLPNEKTLYNEVKNIKYDNKELFDTKNEQEKWYKEKINQREPELFKYFGLLTNKNSFEFWKVKNESFDFATIISWDKIISKKIKTIEELSENINIVEKTIFKIQQIMKRENSFILQYLKTVDIDTVILIKQFFLNKETKENLKIKELLTKLENNEENKFLDLQKFVYFYKQGQLLKEKQPLEQFYKLSLYLFFNSIEMLRLIKNWSTSN